MKDRDRFVRSPGPGLSRIAALVAIGFSFALASDARIASAAVTITDVRLIDYRIDRTKKFVTSKGSSDACYGIYILISAKSDDGTKTFTALGDALPRGTVTNETSKDAATGAAVMREALLGKKLAGTDVKEDVTTIGSWMNELDAIANKQKLTTKKPPPKNKQLRATLCGFDEALLDLVGQVHGKPIFEILGGAKRDTVAIAAPTFNADETADSLAGKVEDADDSYAAMRIKIGLTDDEDVKRVASVARELKKRKLDASEIWVDVNQAWKSAEKSIAMMGRIRDALKEEGFTSRFILEQPTVETDMQALADVTAEMRKWNDGKGPGGSMPFKIVTVADEAVWTLDDAKLMVKLDAADLVNIKIQKSGGLLHSMDIASYLHEAAPNVGVYIGGVVSTDITSWANLQLCLALPRLDYATGCVPKRAYPVNVATVPMTYAKDSPDGKTKTLNASKTPGLGTGLDLEKLEKYIKHDSASTHPATKP